MSVFRLLPKVRVPTTTTMARVEARMDERTGTDVRPRPPSRANRRPSSVGSGHVHPGGSPGDVRCPERSVGQACRPQTRRSAEVQCGRDRAQDDHESQRTEPEHTSSRR